MQPGLRAMRIMLYMLETIIHFWGLSVKPSNSSSISLVDSYLELH